jgi:hypothetical protein
MIKSLTNQDFRTIAIIFLTILGSVLKYGFALFAILIAGYILVTIISVSNGTFLTFREGEGSYLLDTLKLGVLLSISCIVSWLGGKVIQFVKK